jgi:hypothetical protein
MAEIQIIRATATPPFATWLVRLPNRTLKEIKMAKKPKADLATPTFETSRKG